HPDTLADATESTKARVLEVDDPGLRINSDVLDLWESGDDPVAALAELRPMVGRARGKNISARERLDVFARPDVHAAARKREGMVPLFEGAYDYRNFLAHILSEPNLDASLEWFGGDVKQVLTQDCQQILRLKQTLRQETRLAMGA